MDPDVGATTIDALIEAQASKTPESIAVVCAARTLSYRELVEEANRLARVIVERDVPADVPVGIGCALGADLVVAVLAVLKAGRFLVSVNLPDPSVRTHAIVDALGVRTLLVDAAHRSVAHELMRDAGEVLDVDMQPRARPARAVRLFPRPDGVARIALSSGSTGEPKGIVQTHRTTLYGAIARNNAVHLCDEDRMLIGTSTFTELWRPLLVGGTLYLFDFKGDDISRLRRWIATERISAFRATPSVFRQVVATLALRGAADGKGGLFPSLRVVELMGEPVSMECVRLYQRHFAQQCVLINLLGAKEVLDYRIYYIDHAMPVTEGAVPAGYPLGAASVTLVDDNGSPAAPGAVGEIAVSSPSMSPGYWRRPGLTSERFRRDDGHGQRSYLTGDLGMLMPDGCLIHVGRRDSMVKVRGHQVDIAHVEHVLRELESVKDAAIIATAAEPEVALVAFVVPRIIGLTGRDLRRELAARLPEFMVPSEFVILEEMPATTMGKADRDKLRRLASEARSHASRGRPTDPVEAGIAAIWAQALNLDCVELHDNFFELGGNSLMVMQIFARIQQRYAIDLPLSAAFERPTVRALAREVRKGIRAAGRAEAARRRSVGIESIGRRRRS